jgi:hypothetical protein
MYHRDRIISSRLAPTRACTQKLNTLLKLYQPAAHSVLCNNHSLSPWASCFFPSSWRDDYPCYVTPVFEAIHIATSHCRWRVARQEQPIQLHVPGTFCVSIKIHSAIFLEAHHIGMLHKNAGPSFLVCLGSNQQPATRNLSPLRFAPDGVLQFFCEFELCLPVNSRSSNPRLAHHTLSRPFRRKGLFSSYMI